MEAFSGSSHDPSELDGSLAAQIQPRRPPPLPAVRTNLIEDIYPHEFWLEKYNRMNATRPTRVYDIFNYKWGAKERPLAWKFYSHNDMNVHEKCLKHSRNNRRNFQVNPPLVLSDRCSATDFVLTSQVYGSIPNMNRYDVNGNLVLDYRKPLRRASLSDHVEQLAIHRVTERPPFNGLSFKC